MGAFGSWTACSNRADCTFGRHARGSFDGSHQKFEWIAHFESVLACGMAQPAFGISPASYSPLVHRETPVPAAPATDADVIRYIDLKLAALGYTANQHADSDLLRNRASAPAQLSPEGHDAGEPTVSCGPANPGVSRQHLEGRLPRRRRAASRPIRFFWTGPGSRG